MLCVRASVANKAAPCCPVAGGRLCASRMLRRCNSGAAAQGLLRSHHHIAAMEGVGAAPKLPLVSLGISTRTVGLGGYVSHTDCSTAQERRAADAALAAESRRGNAALLDYYRQRPPISRRQT